MRIRLFFDGKNFYRGCRETVPDRRVDFGRLATWLVERAGGERLWGAHYYTGVEIGERAFDNGQSRLDAFLSVVEQLPGFFVRRFPRTMRTTRCSNCGDTFTYSREKEVDSAIVADMVSLAAEDAYDALVLVSGDADFVPALDAVRRLGKLCLVATWGGEGLSARLRGAAYDHIDLLEGLDEFSNAEPGVVPADSFKDHEPDTQPTEHEKTELTSPAEVEDTSTEEFDNALFVELERAEQHFRGGYVGANFLMTRWTGEASDVPFDGRRESVERLIESGRIERYEADDGPWALRVRRER